MNIVRLVRSAAFALALLCPVDAFAQGKQPALNPALNLSDLRSASTARANLGLGTAALLASSAVAQTANNLSDLLSTSTALANLGGLPLAGGTMSGALHLGSQTIDGSAAAFTGGSFSGGVFNGTLGATTPAAIYGTTESLSAVLTTAGGNNGPASGNWRFTMQCATCLTDFYSGNTGNPVLLSLTSASNQVTSEQQFIIQAQGTQSPVWGSTSLISNTTPFYSSLAWGGSSATGSGGAILGQYISHTTSIPAGSNGQTLVDYELHPIAGATGPIHVLNLKVSPNAADGSTPWASNEYSALNALADLLYNTGGVSTVQVLFQGSITGNVLTADAPTQGTFVVGQALYYTGHPAGEYITSFITGAGAGGEYGLSVSTTASTQNMIADGTSGGAAPINCVMHWGPNATNTSGGTCDETDVYSEAGSSMQDKIGHSVILLAADSTQASRTNAAYVVSSFNQQISGRGWLNGIQFGEAQGYGALDSVAGNAIGFVANYLGANVTGGVGLNFNHFTPATAFIETATGFLLDPSSNVRATSFTGNGASLTGITSGQISGLGGAALLNVGTTAGTVAAGNDSRIVGAAQLPGSYTSGHCVQFGSGTALADTGAACGSGGGGGITALTGDVTASGSGSVAASVVAIGGHAVTLGGALTTSGAYGLTLTLSGATNVTLPTTGTLLATNGSGASLTGILASQIGSVPAGVLKGSGGAFAAANAGTDYLAPFASQTANTFYASPNGSAGTPTFRAIVAADLPLGSSSAFGAFKVDGTTITSASGVLSSVGGTAANPTATAGATAINGTATTFMRSDAAPPVAKAATSTFGIVEPDNTTTLATSGVLSTKVTDTVHTATATFANIGGQDDWNGASLTGTLPTLGVGGTTLAVNQGGGSMTIGLGGQTQAGLPSPLTLHNYGFYSCTYNDTGSPVAALSCYGFPGFGTITANALPKTIDATGATAASAVADNGTNVSFSEGAVSTPVALTDASTIAVNAALTNNFTLTLTASGHTMGAPTNPQAGQWINFSITAGAYTMSWNAAFAWINGSAPTLNTSGTTQISCYTLTSGPTYACSGPVNSAAITSQPSTPAGPSSTSLYLMQGLAGSFTPKTTGNMDLKFCSTAVTTDTAAGDGINYQISYGTGTAPTSNTSKTGTQVGTVGTQELAATVTAADVAIGFCQEALVTGLVGGTTYWYDVAAEAVGATGWSFKNVNLIAAELR
jgi:hypothetical protein